MATIDKNFGDIKKVNVEGNNGYHIDSKEFNNTSSTPSHITNALTREFSTLCESLVTRRIKQLNNSPKEHIELNDNNLANLEWKENSEGLYVLIHGLKGHPNTWYKQLDILQEKQPNCDIKIPFVFKKGDCSLEEALVPIEKMIRDYIARNPGKPICLLGFSNGSRIALELETRLRDTYTPIKVSSVAGAFLGTKQMTLASQLKIANLIFNQDLIGDLSYESQKAQDLMERLQNPNTGFLSRFEFYATPTDFMIRPFVASLPHIPNKKTAHFIVEGENHNSLVSKVAEFQIERCAKWMQKELRLSQVFIDEVD